MGKNLRITTVSLDADTDAVLREIQHELLRSGKPSGRSAAVRELARREAYERIDAALTDEDDW